MGEGAADLPLSLPRLPPEACVCKVDGGGFAALLCECLAGREWGDSATMLRRCVHGIAQRGAAFSGAATRSAILPRVATPMLRTVVGAGERWASSTPTAPSIPTEGSVGAAPIPGEFEEKDGTPPLDLEKAEQESKDNFQILRAAMKKGAPAKLKSVDKYAPLLASPLWRQTSPPWRQPMGKS